jgi:hypothetical protein
MKHIEKFLALYLTVIILIISGSLYATHTMQVIDEPAPSLIKLIALALLAIWEVISRLVPSLSNYSILVMIIKLLRIISDALRREPSRPPLGQKLPKKRL